MAIETEKDNLILNQIIEQKREAGSGESKNPCR